MKIKDVLNETLYLNDIELGYEVLGKISNAALSRSYSHFCTIKDIDIFAKSPTGFIAGFKNDLSLSMVVSISARKVAYPKVPTQLNSNYQQVSMVRVSKEFAEQGDTKAVYNAIAKRIDLVSDEEQFLGAQGLWKSLARDSDINVYVFNGNINDYTRDSNGSIKKYNGTNISDDTIWGTTVNYSMILLVGTIKELQ